MIAGAGVLAHQSQLGLAFRVALWTLFGITSTLMIGVTGCTVNESTRPENKPTETKPTSSVVAAKGNEKTFGETLRAETPFVELAEIFREPNVYAGKRVRTRGVVVAVCQAAGCWADIRPLGDSKSGIPAHVMMHNHAFFLPKSMRDRPVELEGNLTVRALSQTEVNHYNGEGASLTAGTPMVQVDAVGIALAD